MDNFLGAVRELVSSTSTHYEGGPSRSSSVLGRAAFSSIIKSQSSPKSDGAPIEDTQQPNMLSKSELVQRDGPMLVSSGRKFP